MSKNSSNSDRIEKKITAVPSAWDKHLTMSVSQFLTASGIGRTTCYRLIASGELETALIGRKRLIVVDSWRRLVERNRAGGEGSARP